MTKHKFQELCEQVLIPLLGNLMFQQQTSVQETLDTVTHDLVDIKIGLSRLLRAISYSDDATDG
jgi:hypothetical protein